MYKSLVRGVLAIMSVSVAFAPTTSEACWLTHCFSCCKPKPAPTYCPPPAPPCDVCPQQVSYVPQTCYRAVETCVPCTTCRPETVCDPCTGPQTVMRPVTTYVRKQVMVPYTTYRPVVTPVATTACSSCSGAAYNSPYYSGAAMPAVVPAVATAPAGCSSCASGYAMPTAGPPMYQSNPAYGSVPMSGSGPITTQPGLSPTTSVPTLATPPAGAPTGTEGQGTFVTPPNSPPVGNTPSAAYQSIPDASRMQPAPPFNGTTSGPALTPASPDRTTARPMYRAASILPAIFGGGQAKNSFVKPVSATRVVEPAPQPVDDGWRPMGGR